MPRNYVPLYLYLLDSKNIFNHKHLQALHPSLLLKALDAIEPETTIERFKKISGISSKSVAKSVLAFLSSNGIGSSTRTTITFSQHDRLSVAILAIRSGCDIEEVSERLSWKDFEKLASKVLLSFGYRTQTNVQLTKPRMEIDVVGTCSEFAIAVDCKHWKNNSLSSIARFSEKQITRAKRLIKRDGISEVVPVIMTLHDGVVRIVGGVPVVPVQKFRSFVMDVKSFLPELYSPSYDKTSIAM
jgi:restriction endonuclease